MSKPGVKGKFKSFFGRKSNGINTGGGEEKYNVEFVFSRDVLKVISFVLRRYLTHLGLH